MAKVYMLVTDNGFPVIWRLQGIKPSIRLYEDGKVADKARIQADDLGYGFGICLIKLDSIIAAQEYANSLVREDIWFHHFPLADGYTDEYKPSCYDCGIDMEECLCEVQGYIWTE